MSIRMRERNEAESCEVGLETRVRRESIDRWRRFGKRGCGDVWGREASCGYSKSQRE